jgi:nucleotide-binding universal stress UspA family protein
MSRIVVGVDGSEHAKRALRWALDEAAVRGAELVVAYVATPPLQTATALAPPGPTAEQLTELGRELVVDEALAEVDAEEVAVERVVRPGHVTEELCELARDADLLVVGARGLGGFRGLLLGSTTQQLVAHAPCPVVVVVPEDR